VTPLIFLKIYLVGNELTKKVGVAAHAVISKKNA
jgi:hypothetical protein